MKLNKLLEEQKFLTNRNEISAWLKSKKVDDFVIKPDLTVDVIGDVHINFDDTMEFLPVKFGIVSGNFSVLYNKLTTLYGCPREVGGGFSCYGNKLESLEGGPKIVGTYYNCSINLLTTLKGAPNEINGDFVCSSNRLTNLQYGPKTIAGAYECSDNQITSVEWLPREVGENFYIRSNRLSKDNDVLRALQNIEVHGYLLH